MRIPWLIKLVGKGMRRGFAGVKPRDGITVEERTIESEGGRRVPIEIYRAPSTPPENAPCFLCLHGGGFVYPASTHHRKLMFRYAKEAACTVVHVDYTLALDAPFPAGLEDCFATLEFLAANADALGIDLERIAVGGDSAGGGLAAGLAHLTRDRKGPPLSFQLLIYPVTDGSLTSESARTFVDTPLWSTPKTRAVRKHYRVDEADLDRSYAFPLHATNFDSLPPAYIETAEFDPLRDDGIDYAHKLEEHGVEVQLHQTKGTVHAFEVVGHSEVTKAALKIRLEALKRGLEQR